MLVQILYYLWKANNATTTVDRAWDAAERYMTFLGTNFSVSANTGSGAASVAPCKPVVFD